MSTCQCSMAISMVGDGCRYCQPQTYIEHLLETLEDARAAPVSEAEAQGEYGDAYQGAREDLAIWKRRALEAEKALQEERIITERLGNALNEENGPTFMGEPVFPAKAQGVV